MATLMLIPATSASLLIGACVLLHNLHPARASVPLNDLVREECEIGTSLGLFLGNANEKILSQLSMKPDGSRIVRHQSGPNAIEILVKRWPHDIPNSYTFDMVLRKEDISKHRVLGKTLQELPPLTVDIEQGILDDGRKFLVTAHPLGGVNQCT